ncbi:MAG: serine/threonine-protein kinase [Myxococcota bacterium]
MRSKPHDGPGSGCPTDAVLARFIEGELHGTELDALEQHLDACAECIELVAALNEDADSDPALAPTVSSDGEHAPIAPVTLQTGSRLGRYVVLDPVGSGGMGVVYGGYDPEIDRKVALKLVRVARDDEGQHRKRLLQEARAMGQLAHPNIVAVYDVGTSDAGVFVAMEFIDGLTLHAWQRTEPRRWSEIIEIYRQTGLGLAEAHQHGVVHRDFKPGNAMVGDDGRVRVLDFGLARLAPSTERSRERAIATAESRSAASSLLTRAGTIMGTPGYMAPEQRAGDPADARSDQYSFCVALHEALVGVRPGADDPSGTTHKVPAFVRQALSRGLAEDPAQRWPDMRSLLDALDPRPRRQKRWLAAAAVGGLALASAFAYERSLDGPPAPCQNAAAQFDEVWGPESKDALKAAISASNSPMRADLERTVPALLDDYRDDWIEGHTTACEATRVHGEQSATVLDRRMTCLERVRRETGSAVELLRGGDEGVLRRAAEIVTELPALSRCADRQALLAAVPPPDDPDTARLVEALHAVLGDVRVQQRAGRYQRGIALATEAIAKADTLDYEPIAARTRLQAGSLHKSAGDDERAAERLWEAYWIARRIGDDETIVEAELELLLVLGARLQQTDAARDIGRHARADIERIGNRDEHWHHYHRSEGAGRLAVGDFEAADEAFEESLRLSRQLYGSNPTTAMDLTNLAMTRTKLARGEEAVELLTEARQIYEQFLGPRHPLFMGLLDSMGQALPGLDRTTEAIDLFERAIEIGDETWGPKAARVAHVRMNLGTALFDVRRFDEAEALFTRVAEVYADHYGPTHTYVATAEYNLGDAAAAREAFESALEHYARALTIFEEQLGADNRHLSPLHLVIARAHLGIGRLDDAARSLDRAEARCTHEDTLEDTCAEVSFTRARLMAENPERRPDAVALARRARDTLRKLRPRHPDLPAMDRFVEAQGVAEPKP